MSRPRILFVSHTGQVSGAEMVLLDIVDAWPGERAFLFEDGPFRRALADRHVDVTVSKWGKTLGDVRRDSSVLRIIPRLWRLLAILGELRRAARDCDLIYANSQKAFVLSAVLVLLTRRPLVWHLHDIISPAHFGKLQRRVQVTLANLAALRVVAPSRVVAEAFVAEGGRAELVEIVANGLDIAADPDQTADLRGRLGLPAGPLVGVFSRLAAWKGQHVVLEALAEVPDVRCVFAGSALFGEQAYADDLKRRVSELGLSDRVSFLGQRADVPQLMRAVNVVVHPSIDPEPFGRTLVEAMLAGVPVIGTDTGAAAEILDAGRAGRLVPARDARTMARAIGETLAQPATALKEQLDYARNRAASLYSRSQMVDSIRRLVGEVSGGAAA